MVPEVAKYGLTNSRIHAVIMEREKRLNETRDGRLLQKFIEVESWAVVALKRLDKRYTIDQLRKAVGMIVIASKEGISLLRDGGGEGT